MFCYQFFIDCRQNNDAGRLCKVEDRMRRSLSTRTPAYVMGQELFSHAVKSGDVLVQGEPCEAALRVYLCEGGRRVAQGLTILRRFQSLRDWSTAIR